jgi:hypothetical protein
MAAYFCKNGQFEMRFPLLEIDFHRQMYVSKETTKDLPTAVED